MAAGRVPDHASRRSARGTAADPRSAGRDLRAPHLAEPVRWMPCSLHSAIRSSSASGSTDTRTRPLDWRTASRRVGVGRSPPRRRTRAGDSSRPGLAVRRRTGRARAQQPARTPRIRRSASRRSCRSPPSAAYHRDDMDHIAPREPASSSASRPAGRSRRRSVGTPSAYAGHVVDHAEHPTIGVGRSARSGLVVEADVARGDRGPSAAQPSTSPRIASLNCHMIAGSSASRS